MYLCWRRGWLKATGRLTGLFLFGYGLARFLVELVRQPDAHIGLLAGGLSMGQILSLPMMLLGLYLLRHTLRPSRDASRDQGRDHE
jgi:phosphatidylglycerol:prolipoprotein diacylglycerol transferase